MDLGPLRELVLDLNLEAHGVDVMVTPKEGAAVGVRAIWDEPRTEDVPGPGGLKRTIAMRTLVLPFKTVPNVQRGMTILAPLRTGEPVQKWRVDGVERIDRDHNRVVVVLDE